MYVLSKLQEAGNDAFCDLPGGFRGHSLKHRLASLTPSLFSGHSPDTVPRRQSMIRAALLASLIVAASAASMASAEGTLVAWSPQSIEEMTDERWSAAKTRDAAAILDLNLRASSSVPAVRKRSRVRPTSSSARPRRRC